MLFGRRAPEMPDASDALPGRDTPMSISGTHTVLGTSMVPPFPDGHETIVVAMGCFWGAETDLLATGWRDHHRGRLRRRVHAESHL